MLAMILVLAACQGGGGTATTGESTVTGGTSGAGTGDGTVRIGWGGAPADLNPGLGVLTEDYTLYDLVYDSPLNIDFQGQFQPELATDWSVSDDGLTWTMTIRDDVTFHDGTPLTAADVAFSISLYRDTEGFPLLPSYVGVFTSIEAPDATTVTLTTEEPIGNFEYRMTGMYVLPSAIWEAIDDPVAFTNDDMIGSGPFILAGYTQDESVILEANPDYWGTVPSIDRVIFQTYANPDARVQALINGELDMITEFPATAIASLRNSQNVAIAQGSYFAGRLADIMFNMIDPANCPPDGGICSGHPALRDLEVRRALAHAVDKQQLIDSILLGLGSVGIGMVPAGLTAWFADELLAEDYQFDLELAASMLEEAGYVDTDGDGIRECPTDDCGPTGDLTFRLNFPTDSDEAPRLADTLSGWWGEIGVNVQIAGLDSDALTSICCPSFDYDVIIWSWTSDTDPEGLLAVMLCDEIPTGFSETGFCDPAYDELYAQQAVETDPAARRELIVEMQRIGLDQVPYIIPWYYQRYQAYRTDTYTGWPVEGPVISLEDPASLSVLGTG
ncbi:MAG TPA: ABC transporter substrate-binding protein [Acidimicrobiia bacterium]